MNDNFNTTKWFKDQYISRLNETEIENPGSFGDAMDKLYKRVTDEDPKPSTQNKYRKNIQDLIKSLPSTRNDVDWKTRENIQLPDVKGEDNLISLFSKDEVKKWIEDFKKIYSEDPKFTIKGEKIEVINPKFKEIQNKYIEIKKKGLKNLGTTDENKNPKKMKKSEFVKFIKEQALSSISEKKKGKKKEEEIIPDENEIPTDVAPEVNVNDVDPNVKAVQDALTQAQAAASKLGDEKLSDQIGNTVTYFTREHISKSSLNENKK